ncbi:galectin-2-like [Neoarius graeffei]|uniref:galectin-2-like n=1 Tax=Neoarius graeffei TaxID=443677 RepID=UPI00298C6972|nr:galectin-2-like [Neoarius graeffei]
MIRQNDVNMGIRYGSGLTEAELKNVLFKVGDQLKVQGRIHSDAKRFRIDLGSSSSELALHFNPRFHDDDDEKMPVLVCNSMCDGIWNQEQRDHNPFQPGSTFKVVVKHAGGLFEVMLPDGQMTEFPNQQELEVITYICIKGDISLTSFKLK